MEEAESVALDAAVLALAQAVEHYEIARHGTLKEWARARRDDAAALISQILDMEKACNNHLTGLAVDGVNKASKSKT